MQRLLYNKLMEWKGSADRMPLIIDGIRQCGKTYLVREFGHNEYASIIELNFEKEPSLKELFTQDLDPKRILRELEILFNKHIVPGRTLLFFDEVQMCPDAITSLKYFCEDVPEYHIISAGSLLGILLSGARSFPVGKVDRMKLYPMSYREFLLACGEELLFDYVCNYKLNDRVTKPILDKLEGYLREYYVVGGMPKAVEAWAVDHDIEKVVKRQKAILSDYSDDFSKHANSSGTQPESKVNIHDITQVWNSIPGHLARENNKFVFSHVRTGARSKDLERAISWLCDAGLIYKVCRSETPAIPLKANHDCMNYKVYLADIGLLRCLADYPPNFMRVSDERYKNFKGSFTENYVLNELLHGFGESQYFWNDGRHEVDFLLQFGNSIIPLEVKSERRSSSTSLSAYSKKYDPEKTLITNLTEVRDNTVPLPLIGCLSASLPFSESDDV